ncbi:MAG: hypothetical protein KGL39_17025 [Patescibacteria group bacterium]|nr:hypothetical protein [Patescibacteria group bacterium]
MPGKNYVYFDSDGRPIGLGTSPNTGRKFRRKVIAKTMLLSELPTEERISLKKMFSAAEGSDKRRRTGGHGYAGGDGFVDL